MVVPGESSGGWSIDQIVAHEYGHHLANNRINPPWNALSWGTKRGRRTQTSADGLNRAAHSPASPAQRTDSRLRKHPAKRSA
jgi:hypothetical protein